jgi:hypothetical protein
MNLVAGSISSSLQGYVTIKNDAKKNPAGNSQRDIHKYRSIVDKYFDLNWFALYYQLLKRKPIL